MLCCCFLLLQGLLFPALLLMLLLLFPADVFFLKREGCSIAQPGRMATFPDWI
jgi:hypothetical protein